MMPDTSPVRILVADDQADILDALQAPAARRGLRGHGGAVARRGARAARGVGLRPGVLDLNYTRDTTSGQEGFDLMERIRALDPTLPVLVMTGVEQRRRGGRGHAARRPRLHREAVGRREAAGGGAGRRSSSRRAVRRNQRLQEANARLQRGATPGVHRRGAPACVEVRQTIERIAPSDAARAHHRRARHRQGSRRGLAARARRARGKAARHDERGRPGGRHRRERAVRPREGGVHRRARRSHRLLRDGRRGHAVPRRDREHADAPAGQAAARAADRRGAAGRLVAACATSTCACSRPPTPICTRRSRPDGSARICSTASTPS